MPIAQRGERGGRQLLMLAAATVLGLVAMVWLFTQVGGTGSNANVQVSIGDDVFLAGNVDRLADDIAKLETPLLLGDVSGGDRDIFLQHIGDDDRAGWYAFAVRPLAATRDCFVEWQPDDETFVDNCDGTVYPSTGEGLPPYPIDIDEDGFLTIDLRSADAEN
ncbi:MAG: hypothetical protein R2733_07455 [Acidimicrobiales bacterium]